MSSNQNDNVGSSRPPGLEKKTRAIYLIQSDLTKLREYQQSLTETERQLFRDTFGNFERIAEVSVDEKAIRALIPFYDSQSRAFKLRNLDIAPTLDEYYYLLSPTWDRDQVKIYTQALKNPPGFYLGRILPEQFGIKAQWSQGMIHKRDGYYDINWEGIYSAALKDRKEGMTSRQKINFLALGIFGLILFPTTPRHIDSRILLLIIDIIQKPKENIAAMVLAETLRSIEYCSNHKKASYKICTQILTVWIHNHFPTQKDHRTRNFFESSAWSRERNLIGYYSLPTCVREGCQEWYDLFNTVQSTEISFSDSGSSNGIRWRVPWMKEVNSYVIPAPGDQSFPLFGLFGTIGYSPNWVTQQLGDEQEIPQYDLDRGFDKDYSQLTLEEQKQFRDKWNMTETKVARNEGFTVSYEQWRKDQMTRKELPSCPKPTLQVKIASLRKQLAETEGDLSRERTEGKEREVQRALKERSDKVEKGKYEAEKEKVAELEQNVKELQGKLDMALDEVLLSKDDAREGWGGRKKFKEEIEDQRNRARNAERNNLRLREEIKRRVEPDPKKIKLAIEDRWKKEIYQLKDYKEAAEYLSLAEQFREILLGIWEKKNDPVGCEGMLLEIANLLERISTSTSLTELARKDERVQEWIQEALNSLSKIHKEVTIFKTDNRADNVATLHKAWTSVDFAMTGQCNNFVKSAVRRHEILRNKNFHDSVIEKKHV